MGKLESPPVFIAPTPGTEAAKAPVLAPGTLTTTNVGSLKQVTREMRGVIPTTIVPQETLKTNALVVVYGQQRDWSQRQLPDSSTKEGQAIDNQIDLAVSSTLKALANSTFKLPTDAKALQAARKNGEIIFNGWDLQNVLRALPPGAPAEFIKKFDAAASNGFLYETADREGGPARIALNVPKWKEFFPDNSLSGQQNGQSARPFINGLGIVGSVNDIRDGASLTLGVR